MDYTYKTKGTCSTHIELSVEDGVVQDVAFWMQRKSARHFQVGERNACRAGVEDIGRYSLWGQTDILSRSALSGLA